MSILYDGSEFSTSSRFAEPHSNHVLLAVAASTLLIFQSLVFVVNIRVAPMCRLQACTTYRHVCMSGTAGYVPPLVLLSGIQRLHMQSNLTMCLSRSTFGEFRLASAHLTVDWHKFNYHCYSYYATRLCKPRAWQLQYRLFLILLAALPR